MLVKARQRWTDGEKERVTLHSSFMVVVQRTSRPWYGANVDGKKKKSDEEAKKKH
jgi:hypothetical protein